MTMSNLFVKRKRKPSAYKLDMLAVNYVQICSMEEVYSVLIAIPSFTFPYTYHIPPLSCNVRKHMELMHIFAEKN